MNDKYKKIKTNMEAAQKTCGSRFGVRCPSLKVMADYINNVLDGFNANIEKTSCCRGRQMRSGVYYSSKEYYGNKLIVRKDGNLVFEHDSTKTYRYNVEVVRWIFSQEK